MHYNTYRGEMFSFYDSNNKRGTASNECFDLPKPKVGPSLNQSCIQFFFYPPKLDL